MDHSLALCIAISLAVIAGVHLLEFLRSVLR